MLPYTRDGSGASPPAERQATRWCRGCPPCSEFGSTIQTTCECILFKQLGMCPIGFLHCVDTSISLAGGSRISLPFSRGSSAPQAVHPILPVAASGGEKGGGRFYGDPDLHNNREQQNPRSDGRVGSVPPPTPINIVHTVPYIRYSGGPQIAARTAGLTRNIPWLLIRLRCDPKRQGPDHSRQFFPEAPSAALKNPKYDPKYNQKWCQLF